MEGPQTYIIEITESIHVNQDPKIPNQSLFRDNWDSHYCLAKHGSVTGILFERIQA